jgi:8-oxo-dGTP pyrophosphatase MutT (NUDIX family)
MTYKHRKIDAQRGFDFIGVNCVFWCHDKKNRLLLHKRSQKCRDEQGTWDSGAGSMEFGETFEQTVNREILEEYGVKPLKIEYLGTENVLRIHKGRQTHWIKNLHWVLVDSKKVKNNDPEKIDEIGWFDFDKMPQPLHSQFAKEVDYIKKYFGKKSAAEKNAIQKALILKHRGKK